MFIRVRATAGAKRERVDARTDGSLVIAVREKAEDNRANARIRTLVAAHLALPVRAVRLIRGHRSRSKLFEANDTHGDPD